MRFTRCVMHVPDLAILVLDYCDDVTLYKLSCVDSYLRNMLTSKDYDTNGRALRKGYVFRIMEHKFKVAS